MKGDDFTSPILVLLVALKSYKNSIKFGPIGTTVPDAPTAPPQPTVLILPKEIFSFYSTYTSF